MKVRHRSDGESKKIRHAQGERPTPSTQKSRRLKFQFGQNPTVFLRHKKNPCTETPVMPIMLA